jgi:hypothetical protein
MSHQIIQQPDGRFCVFSTVVDALVLVDATADALLDYYGEQAAAEAERRVKKIIANVTAGNARKSYYQFTLTYDEAVIIDADRNLGTQLSES